MSKWEKVRFGDVCDVRDGTHDSPKYIDHGYPLVTSKNLTNGYIDITDVNYISKDDYNKIIVRSGVDNGDIIMPMIGTIGNPVVVHKTFDFAIKNVALIKFISNNVLNKYIFYILSSSIFKRYIEIENRGGTQKFISLGNIRNFMIPLPPLEAQKQISKTLDTVAELLAMRKQQLAELDNLIKSTFYNMFGDAVANEKGWEVKQLSAYCSVNPRKSEIDHFTDNFQVSFVAMPSVSANGDIDSTQIRAYKEVKTGFTYFYEDDVLFAKITPCMENGKGAIARSLKNNIGFGSTEFHVLRAIEGVSNSEWLYRLTTLPIFRENAEKNMSGSAGQKRVPTSFFDKFMVSLPPLSLQIRFASIVTKIEEQKALVKKAIDETQVLFDSLMSEYFE